MAADKFPASDEWRRRNQVDEPFTPVVDAKVRRILEAPLPPKPNQAAAS